jgi:hypothetical protein
VRFYREARGDADLAKIPVIVVTAVTGFGGDPESFKNFLGTRPQVPPPDGFVPKPVDREALLKAVAELLAG